MNHGLTQKVARVNTLIRERRFGDVDRALRTRLRSDAHEIGLMRDLTVPFAAPDAQIPIDVRTVEPDELLEWLNNPEPGISDEERWDRTSRAHLLNAGFSTCFVAATADGRPCYIQWLIHPWENDLSQKVFNGRFPRLEPSEVLLEGAFTFGKFRGQKIMPAAMARIADHAADMGARRAITFVGNDNVPSLKGCFRAGFTPYMERTVSYRLGTLRVHPAPLSEKTPLTF